MSAPSLVIFDIQHAGRPSKPGDAGAAYDLDGDGVRGENGEREVDLVTGYVAAARAALESRGVRVAVLTAGEYGERHLQAIRLAAGERGSVAYLACHTNAGGGSYGLIRADHRSAAGYALAIRLALALRLPEVSKVRLDLLYPSAAAAKAAGKDVSAPERVAWRTRGWSCIDGIYSGPANLCGVLVEPLFADSAAHRSLVTPAGLVRVGEALAAGLAS